MVWCQGCTDGDIHTNPELYYKQTAEMLHSFLEECGIETCFLIQIGNDLYDPNRYRPIQEAQIRLAKQETNVVLVSRQFALFAERGLMKDEFHYLQEGYNLVGTEAGKNAGCYIRSNGGIR